MQCRLFIWSVKFYSNSSRCHVQVIFIISDQINAIINIKATSNPGINQTRMLLVTSKAMLKLNSDIFSLIQPLMCNQSHSERSTAKRFEDLTDSGFLYNSGDRSQISSGLHSKYNHFNHRVKWPQNLQNVNVFKTSCSDSWDQGWKRFWFSSYKKFYFSYFQISFKIFEYTLIKLLTMILPYFLTISM